MVLQHGLALPRMRMLGRHGPAEGHVAKARRGGNTRRTAELAGSIPVGPDVHDPHGERATRGTRAARRPRPPTTWRARAHRASQELAIGQRADLAEWQTRQHEELVSFGASGFKSRDRYELADGGLASSISFVLRQRFRSPRLRK